MLFVETFVIHRVKKDYTLTKILAVLMMDCICTETTQYYEPVVLLYEQRSKNLQQQPVHSRDSAATSRAQEINTASTCF